MDENEEQSLDSEYKRYLEIMRPYLGQLLDQDVIQICNAWIRRLSSCERNEKVLRNKYIFTMCYQLAKGILEEPFLQIPTSDALAPLQEGTIPDNSMNESSEVEYAVLDLDSTKTKVLYSSKNNNIALFPEISCTSEYSRTDQSNDFHTENKTSVNSGHEETEGRDKQTVVCFCPNIVPKFPNEKIDNENYYQETDYEHRATNLIMKLREIKTQNIMLQNELMALREDSRSRREYIEKYDDNVIKVHNTTSTHVCAQDSTATLSSIKHKLQEVQDSRKSLIETISHLQDKLDNFDEIKRHEIEDLLAQHKLEIIQIKSYVRDELKANHDKNVDEIKQQSDEIIKDIQNKHIKETENFKATAEATIAEKDKIILSMGTEISDLRNYIENLKTNQYFMFSNFLDNPKNNFASKCMTQKAEELERRLNKMEKSKIKFSKIYDAKLANLQKEKHLTECSLQLQLMKQRAEIIKETTDEHQTELVTTLDKLESKYKDIVANVQATAVQRRMQDQIALESIIQTVCGIRHEALQCNTAQATFTSQLSNKAMRNQIRDAHLCSENELPNIIRDNKVGSVIVGKKNDNPFTRENIALNNYFLEGNKLSELYERVHVPQRDTGESSPKK